MSVTDKLEAGQVVNGSSVREIPGIGQYLGERLEELNLNTVGQLVRYFSNHAAAWIRPRLTAILQNRFANQCRPVRANEANVRQFLDDNDQEDARYLQYHVREVNMQAYNAVLELLRWARLPANRNDFGAVPINIPSVPAPHVARALGSTFCSCIARRTVCARFANSCEWVDDDAACVPIDEGEHGFEPAGSFKGQSIAEGPAPAPRRGIYAQNWKQPQAHYPHLPLPPAGPPPRGGPAAARARGGGAGRGRGRWRGMAAARARGAAGRGRGRGAAIARGRGGAVLRGRGAAIARGRGAAIARGRGARGAAVPRGRGPAVPRGRGRGGARARAAGRGV